jgi:hypothetical protein
VPRRRSGGRRSGGRPGPSVGPGPLRTSASHHRSARRARPHVGRDCGHGPVAAARPAARLHPHRAACRGRPRSPRQAARERRHAPPRVHRRRRGRGRRLHRRCSRAARPRLTRSSHDATGGPVWPAWSRRSEPRLLPRPSWRHRQPAWSRSRLRHPARRSRSRKRAPRAPPRGRPAQARRSTHQTPGWSAILSSTAPLRRHSPARQARRRRRAAVRAPSPRLAGWRSGRRGRPYDASRRPRCRGTRQAPGARRPSVRRVGCGSPRSHRRGRLRWSLGMFLSPDRENCDPGELIAHERCQCAVAQTCARAKANGLPGNCTMRRERVRCVACRVHRQSSITVPIVPTRDAP